MDDEEQPDGSPAAEPTAPADTARPTVRWSDFSAPQQATIIGAALVEISLLVAALVDLKRRPAEQMRGRKGVWAAVSFVNFIGPLSYFAFGRKR